MFDIKEKISLQVFAITLVLGLPLIAVAQETKSLNDYLPGIMLDAQTRNTLETDKLDGNLFPSERYNTQDFGRDELYRLYDEKQYNKIVFGLLRLARQGDAEAEQTIGVMYRFGQGLKPDDDQALRWFLRASEGQQPLAQHHLGSMYYNGEGVPRDLLKAAMYMGLAVQNYADGPEKEQAIEDFKNINLRLSRIEREQAREMMKDYLLRFPKKAD